jgi:nucleoside-diphosphate-sugar epimerase
LIRHRNDRPTAPDRVVVLGATGFVAADLLAHLDDLDVKSLALSSSDYDLREPGTAEALRSVLRPGDALVFVSALTPDRGRDVGTLMANLTMGQTVCGALETAVAQVVYVSSDAVYADGHGLLSELSPCDPSSFHGLMHLARETMLSQTLKAKASPLLLLRPSLLFGARDTHNGYGPNRFIRSALADRRITLFGEGEERRDHVYVRDLSRLIGLALMHRTEGVLNVATGASSSFREFARRVAGRVGPGVEVVGVPRQSPVTHRHFDVTARIKAFPGFAFTTIDAALDNVLAELPLPAEARGAR